LVAEQLKINCYLKTNIIIPCYNPQEHWEIDFVPMSFELADYIKNLSDIKIILVDDGSTKNFDSKVETYLKQKNDKIEVIRLEQNQGKGAAIKQGILSSKADFYVFTDIDFPFGLESIKEVINKLKEGSEVVMTNRGSEYPKLLPFKRRIITFMIRKFNRYLFRLEYVDTQSGLKGFNQKAHELFGKSKINGFVFDIELVLNAKKMQLKVSEVPVKCIDNIEFTDFRKSVILAEFFNFIKLVLKN